MSSSFDNLIKEIYDNILYENLGRKHLFPDGKRKARKQAAFLKLKKQKLSNARNNIVKIKKHLKELGYTVKLAHKDYTIRKDRIVGLKKPEVSILHKIEKYHVALIALAHEYGHVLQWDESTDTKLMFDFWFQKKYKNRSDQKAVEQIRLAQTMYYELDAWDKARQFIPTEIYQYFLTDMKICLDGYKRGMTHINFNQYPMIIELARKLNYRL